jgi:putative transposase
MGLEDVMTAPYSPWQDPYVERLIGSLRREVLKQVIILDERHLRRGLQSSLGYSHQWRTHHSLIMDCPHQRPVQRLGVGEVMAVPEVGGLHHHNEPCAASWCVSYR